MTEVEVPRAWLLLRDFLIWASFVTLGSLLMLGIRNVLDIVKHKERWRWGAVVFFASLALIIGIATDRVYHLAAVEPTGRAQLYLYGLLGLSVGGMQMFWNARRTGARRDSKRGAGMGGQEERGTHGTGGVGGAGGAGGAGRPGRAGGSGGRGGQGGQGGGRPGEPGQPGKAGG